MSRGEAGGAFGFHPDYPHPGLEMLQGECQAGHQPGAANGNNHSIHIRNLCGNFQAQGSLTGNDGGIVISVNVPEAFFSGDFIRTRARFGKIGAVQHDRGSKSPAIRHLRQRGKTGHHDGH